MKKIIGYFLASMMGGLIVLFFSPKNQIEQNSNSELLSNSNVQKVNLAASSDNFFHSDVLADAAALSLPAVVKIRGSKNAVTQNDRKDVDSNDPFGFFRQFEPPSVGNSGSGVIISSEGYIATNSHVVGESAEFEVILHDKRVFSGTLVGVDKKSDLAVIKIEASNLPAIQYGNSDAAKIGDWVLAIGNPFDFLTSTVTAGIISAKGRDIDMIGGRESIESFIQTDAAVNPGNSGGALVNTEGALIGINTAIASQTGTFSGYSFAIPVNMMKRIVQDLIQYGTYKRAMLGVMIAEIDENMGSRFGRENVGKIIISTVNPGGAAELGGVHPDDIILSVNDININSVPQLQEIISAHKVGKVINIDVQRKGIKKALSIKLKEG